MTLFCRHNGIQLGLFTWCTSLGQTDSGWTWLKCTTRPPPLSGVLDPVHGRRQSLLHCVWPTPRAVQFPKLHGPHTPHQITNSIFLTMHFRVMQLFLPVDSGAKMYSEMQLLFLLSSISCIHDVAVVLQALSC